MKRVKLNYDFFFVVLRPALQRSDEHSAIQLWMILRNFHELKGEEGRVIKEGNRQFNENCLNELSNEPFFCAIKIASVLSFCHSASLPPHLPAPNDTISF